MIDERKRTELLEREATGVDVLTDAALGNGLKLLVHHGDAAMQCIERALDLHLFPLIINFALVHVINVDFPAPFSPISA